MSPAPAAPIAAIPLSLSLSDPASAVITSIMNAATAGITLATKVFDAMPATAKAQAAGDYATIMHELTAPVIALWGKIDAALGVKL